MPPPPPHVATIPIIGLVCGHTDHDGRFLVVEASAASAGSWRHDVIGEVIVRRWAHIVEIVQNSFRFFVVTTPIAPSAPAASMPVALPAAAALLVVLLALLLAPAPVFVLLLEVPSTATAAGQGAVSACQVVRHAP